jgi:hypothetical protein
MSTTVRRRLAALALGPALLWCGAPTPARAAQTPADSSTSPARGPGAAPNDSAPPIGATLRTWEESARLTIFDRGGAFDGPLSERGILQRFDDEMDGEYDLDVVSSGFSLTEDYAWHRRGQGARFWTGSIHHRRLIQRGEVKAGVDLGGAWGADVRFDHDETLSARRNLMRLGVRRDLAAGRWRAFLTGTLKAEKPEADLETGVVWSSGPGEVTVAIGALDLFSDLIYQTLVVARAFADSALDYTSHPFTARTAADLRVADGVRVEGYGLVMSPTRLAVESQTEPGVGFVQDERYAYAGALLEWRPGPGTAVGGLVTWVRARIDRAPLEAGDPTDEFDLTEKSWRLGAFGIHRLSDRVSLEALVARLRRTEDRIRPPGAEGPTLVYSDRTWEGRWDLAYESASGLRAVVGIDFTLGSGGGVTEVQPIQEIARHDWRVRLDLGVRLGRRALFLIGTNQDLDRDGFDGAHGRFVLHW